MESCFVRHEEFIRKQLGINNNEIDKWWNKICSRMPRELQKIAKNIHYELIKMDKFNYSNTLGEKYYIKTNNSSVNRFLAKEGPFIVIVGPI